MDPSDRVGKQLLGAGSQVSLTDGQSRFTSTVHGHFGHHGDCGPFVGGFDSDAEDS